MIEANRSKPLIFYSSTAISSRLSLLQQLNRTFFTFVISVECSESTGNKYPPAFTFCLFIVRVLAKIRRELEGGGGGGRKKQIYTGSRPINAPHDTHLLTSWDPLTIRACISSISCISYLSRFFFRSQHIYWISRVEIRILLYYLLIFGGG